MEPDAEHLALFLPEAADWVSRTRKTAVIYRSPACSDAQLLDCLADMLLFCYEVLLFCCSTVLFFYCSVAFLILLLF
ncbi:hypothetical protein [Paenibacillus sp. NPDC058174]|uniref:hypothetical protein n=1 Tax=Paenibacillus sp. NPDC058174 TaxID=3346366 RepID=UPI0036DB35AD